MVFTKGHKINVGKPRSQEVKEKISKAQVGKKIKRTHLENIRKSAILRRELYRGTNNPFYGKTHSEETLMKMREKKLGVQVSEKWRKSMSPFWKSNKGENNVNWKGGQHKNSQGYVYLYAPEHPYRTKSGYIRRTRKVMESYIGRYILKGEVIHHINRIKDDDRIENLWLFPNDREHQKWHAWERSVEHDMGKHVIWVF